MTVELFGKENCKLCAQVKDKLARMKVPFTDFDLDKAIEHHPGWRSDGTVELMAGFAMIQNRVPMLRIGGEYHSYASAMSQLKRSATEEGAAGKAH